MKLETKIEANPEEIYTNELYSIIVYGFVPEFMPHRALPRGQNYKTANTKAMDTKAIKCPYCNHILTVVEASAKLELLRYPKSHKTKITTHKSMSCGSCRNVVGIIYAA